MTQTIKTFLSSLSCRLDGVQKGYGKKRVFVACEFSQVVCMAFRKLGHEAFSCDLLPCEGGHPEWHIQDDCLKHLNDGWDLMIAHPPCTYLCVAGAQYLKRNKNRWDKMREASQFFGDLQHADIPKICIENPIPHKYAALGKYSQIIRMWEFGHPEAHKPTCLWLKGLPALKPTRIVEPLPSRRYPNGKVLSQWRAKNVSAKNRSRTFPGIASAMAEQWGGKVMEDSYQITDLITGATFNIFISEYSEEKVRERVREIRERFERS